MNGVLYILRNGTLREGLEIQQTGIAPPLCITGLDAELTLHLTESLTIDIGLNTIPRNEELTRLLNACVVLMAQLFPEGATTPHAEIPRHMMEPGYQVLRTGVDIVEHTAELIGILIHVGTTIRGTIETQSDTVCLVVVKRCPVRTNTWRIIPRLGSVVVTSSKDMMQT